MVTMALVLLYRTCTRGDIQLQPGNGGEDSDTVHGLVQLCYNNISDSSSTTLYNINYYDDYYRSTWTYVEAEIACRELGCAEGALKELLQFNTLS